MGRLLQFFGFVLMAFAVTTAFAVAPSASPAIAKGWKSFARVVAQVAAPAPPEPSATQAVEAKASPTPTPEPRRRSAPLLFSLTGSVAMGERSEHVTRGDLASGTLSSLNDKIQTNNAGLLAHVERRTPSSSFELSVPAGFAVNQTTLGALQAGYYTPRFGFVYGAQPLSFLGGVPVGSTIRGLSLVLPLRGGDLTLYDGPALGPGNTMERVTGFRGRTLYRQTLLEFGYDRGVATDGSGHVDDYIVGFAQNRGLLAHSFEAALQHQSDDAGQSARAYAYQYRADYGSNTFYSTTTLRRISDGFLSLGGGFVQRSDFASAGVRGNVFGENVSVDQSLERSGVGVLQQLTRRGSLTLDRQFARRNISTMLSLSDQRNVTGYGTTWTGGATGQIGFDVAGVTTLLGVNGQRMTNSFAPASAIVSYTAGLQHEFNSYFASATYQATRQISDQTAAQNVGTFAMTREFGNTALTFSDSLAHVISPASDAIQSSPQVTLTRRLSPALALAVNYGQQRTTDKLNPSGNARTKIFGVQIAAPFAIGSGVVGGRIDPNLPATITGIVVDEANSTQFTSFISAVGNGVGNVAVVLDGNEVQRTDLSGHFQFNFVRPGIHQLRLETASLPRGVTADQPFATLTVLGGQSGQVNFRLGTYGGVEGHILGRDAAGALFPLSSVVMRLDDTQLSTTGPLGAYGFGRLTAGTHTVSIEPSSVIASVGFAETKKTVTVRNGEVSIVDFTAAPLGSIAGKLVYDAALAPMFTGGVLNAYVVAEPGEHAAITDDNGDFIIDNLPPGTYSIDVDPETLPDETGSLTPSQTITLDGAGHADGVKFTIGHKQKAVVFSLKSDETPLTMTLSTNRLPPGGSATALVDAPADAKGVVAEAFGTQVPLAYDKRRGKWAGDIIVPITARGGNADVTAEIADKKSAAASATLVVDKNLPLVSVDLTPRNYSRGEYVRVRARFLAPVAAGTTIRWLDGQTTTLPKPVSGRIFLFTVKISEQPMRGSLLTRAGELPIILR